MKSFTTEIGCLLVFSTMIGSGYGASEVQLGALMIAHGTNYVTLRNSVLHEPLLTVSPANSSNDVIYLVEILELRRKKSPWIAAFDQLIATNNGMRINGAIDAENLAKRLPAYAPLAGCVREFTGLNKNNEVAVRHIALATLEYFWKIADDEYEVYNALCMLGRRDLMRPIKERAVPLIVCVASSAESERIAVEAISLLHQYGLPNDDVRIIGKVFRKYQHSDKIRLLCKGYLEKYPENVTAKVLMKEIENAAQEDEKRKDSLGKDGSMSQEERRELFLKKPDKDKSKEAL